MRGVGGKARGALQFFAGQLELGFGALPVRAVFLGVHGKPLDGSGEPGGKEVAGDRAAEQEERTGDRGLPTESSLPRQQPLERIHAHLVSGLEE